MSVIHLNGNYPGGYTVAAGNTRIYVGGSAYIGGAGLVMNGANAYTINNLGHIAGDGVYITHGSGSVYNASTSDPHAVIYGRYTGVYVKGPGAVVNAGSIFNGGPQATSGFAVELDSGGRVANGGASNYGALIEGSCGVGIYNGSGSIFNYGTIFGTTSFGAGAGLYVGGSLTNGTADDTSAVIRGAIGVTGDSAAVTIANFGTIISDYGKYGAFIRGGGTVTNGTNLDTTAIIRGSTGISFRYNFPASVANFGTIEGTSLVTKGYGLNLEDGGEVTNGSSLDRRALIEGYVEGIDTSSAGASVTNFATIIGATGNGIFMRGGGFVANGGGTDRSALIEGVFGLDIEGGTGLQNFGTVMGVGAAGTYGAVINATQLGNGSVTNSTATIDGYSGAQLDTAATNFGTIQGLGDTGGEGVSLGGGSLVNESKGLIEGYVGAIATSAAELVNYGRIVGDGGVAVSFESSSDALVVGAGSSFVGSVNGDGGELVLANGTGTLTGLLAGDNVTVSGSMATTTFNNFATVGIGSGASFALAGTGGTIGAGQALSLAGTLSGAGTLSLTGGTATFDGGASLTIAKVSQSGGTANFAAILTVSDAWTQTAGAVTVASGDRVNFAGTDSFSGTLTGAGSVYFTGGTDALTAATLLATTMVVNGGAVTLSGATNLTKTFTVTSPNLTIAAAGATLSGAGTFYLNTLATSAVIGATSGATLTNNLKIQGTGQLGDGQLTLVNSATGSINAFLTTALTINTGAGSFTNAGLVESTNTGGLTIIGAVNNTGTLSVTKGTLQVGGAVTGAGTVRIAGGTADFASTFSENVTFSSTTGVLELSHSQTYTGQVTGLSKTGTSSLDLLDITFGGTTKATFSGTTTSGTLTVTDGTHTAHITLEGNYVGHTFTTSADGHGGTTVVDPTVPKAGGHVVPLVSAMAGFGGNSSASLVTAPPNRTTSMALLAAPA